VDDDAAACEAVAALVGEMGVVAKTYPSAEAFLHDYDGHRPGCLVTDVRMLGMSGVELQEKLARDGISLSVVVLTAYADTRTTIRAIQGGAVTLLEKPCRDQELWDAIQAALRQDVEKYSSEQRLDEIRHRIAALTPAEKKVLELIVQGLSNKVMAKRLGVSVRTIEVRRHRVFEKLQADSLAELVRMYLEAFPQDAARDGKQAPPDFR
jgi:RNA polymerase sigma factor (sigma-70 family)